MMKNKPMLAYPVSDKPIDYSKPVYMQPKLDGVRCLIQARVKRHILTSDLNEIEVKAYSRTDKEWKNIDHILKELIPFFTKHPNVVLDGELYNHDFRDNFEGIISMVRKTKPTDKDIIDSFNNVQFHCYDIINKKMKFSTRNAWIARNLKESYCIKLLNTYWVDSEVEARIRHKLNLDYGYEGSIIRLDTPYQCKRSHSLR